MVSFCKCGEDKFICQDCGRDLCSHGCDTKKEVLEKFMVSFWVEGKGNVCGECMLERLI